MSGTEGLPSKDGTSGNARTAFVEGDFVVYPNHGAGRVTGIEEKTVLGEARRYYVVYLPDAELTVSVPADVEVGLRACIDEDSVAKALALLGAGATRMPPNWNRRLKHNQEKIRSGEISQVAEVIRNLSAYDAEHGLSTGERNLLVKARQIFASEIALVRNIEVAEAEKLVDDALRAGAGGGAE